MMILFKDIILIYDAIDYYNKIWTIFKLCWLFLIHYIKPTNMYVRVTCSKDMF
jgi:hypothetical protein